jgi:hypothetical protein
MGARLWIAGCRPGRDAHPAADRANGRVEPILEADFLTCSYGFRPGHRAHDAIAETRYLAARSYEWIVEGDIAACFDEISHRP